MNQKATNEPDYRSYFGPAAIFTVIHFAVMSVIGYFLFEHYGFSKTPLVKFYEAWLGAGVVLFGLPDTVSGWLINSVIYGIVGAILFRACVRAFKSAQRRPIK